MSKTSQFVQTAGVNVTDQRIQMVLNVKDGIGEKQAQVIGKQMAKNWRIM